MTTTKTFVADMKKIHTRARQHLEHGAVTDGYRADREQAERSRFEQAEDQQREQQTDDVFAVTVDVAKRQRQGAHQLQKHRRQTEDQDHQRQKHQRNALELQKPHHDGQR